jgi:hypothetical protein
MLYTNIVHRLDHKAISLDALRFQWQAACERGLATTTLLSYPAMWTEGSLAMAQEFAGEEGQELGVHLHAYNSERFEKRYGEVDPGFWLLPRKVQTGMLTEMMERFAEVFGAYPVSVGGYVLDAWILKWLRKRYPQVRTAITSCFEEGVRMYQGNNKNWMLFSDGGPWAPYFPSKANALMPAINEEEGLDVVAIPHLNRDMMMALFSRDDLFASHPGNLVRARINQGSECPYFFRFLEGWRRQVDLNGWGYLNLFISSPWVSDTHWTTYHPEDTRTLYLKMLDWVKETDGVEACTMDAFGESFREKVRPGNAMICQWKDELMQSKREVVWLVNGHHRVALDLGLGGAVVDYRPYSGRQNGDVGPETACQWNGNVPFVISAGLRGSFWRSGWVCEISGNGEHFGLADRRLRSEVKKEGEGWRVVVEPLKISLGEGSCVLHTEWEMDASAGLRVRRMVSEVEGIEGGISVKEIFRGSWGTTEYPEDMRGIRMIEEGTKIGVEFPPLRSAIIMEMEADAVKSTLEPARLFYPNFMLCLESELKPETPVTTCLTTFPLTIN